VQKQLTQSVQLFVGSLQPFPPPTRLSVQFSESSHSLTAFLPNYPPNTAPFRRQAKQNDASKARHSSPAHSMGVQARRIAAKRSGAEEITGGQADRRRRKGRRRRSGAPRRPVVPRLARRSRAPCPSPCRPPTAQLLSGPAPAPPAPPAPPEASERWHRKQASASARRTPPLARSAIPAPGLCPESLRRCPRCRSRFMPRCPHKRTLQHRAR
jgi:hypothetical protein